MIPARIARRALSSCAALALALAAGTATAAARVVLPDDVVPEAYRIDFTPHVDEARFEGRVQIELRVRRATRRIVLDSADLALDAVALSGEKRAPAVQLDAKAETATFTFDHPLAPGPHTLTIAYRGHIGDDPSGLFRLDYPTPAGRATALFTQFENTDARRFVPCWDEPGRKARFELTATVPAALMAVGNMPVASTQALGAGLKRVRFAPTPPMSSYLLFFGLGDFERVHRTVDGVDLGVVVKRGDTASAAYALDAAAAILAYYDDYFGLPYPLPKMDMVAGPGQSAHFGAMENWGALFYFERDLLVDPRLATEAGRQRVFDSIAHEMAHQWFGNLVTMAWWDDLWLNEGFANWMAAKAAAHVHPEWNPWLQALASKQHAMARDARPGTHALVMDIPDIASVEGAFDEITYDKGEQVVRTLEATLGEEPFRAGVRRYLKAHAYANATTEDLWTALAAGPATAIARDLSRQPGVPLVEELGAQCVGGRTRVRLAQGQFAIDPDPAGPRRWHLPVRLAVSGGGSADIVVFGPQPQAAEVEGCGTLVINAGQTAYFRTRYDAAGQADVARDLARLPADDELGVLDDTLALALAGREPMGDALELVGRVPADADPVVARAVVAALDDLDRLHDGLDSQARFRAFAQALLVPLFVRTGWQARPGESPNEALLREQLVRVLGRLGEPGVIAGVDARFAAFEADPASLDAALRPAVLAVAAGHADAARWEALHARARAASSFLESQQAYLMLASAQDPALRQRAVELALSGEPPASIAAQMLEAAAREQPLAVLGMLSQHWAEARKVLGSDGAGDVLRRFFTEASDPALIPALQSFAERFAPGLARSDLAEAQAAVRYRAGLRASRMPEVDRWIAAHPVVSP